MYILITSSDGDSFLVVNHPSMDAGDWRSTPSNAITSWHKRDLKSHYGRETYATWPLLQVLADIDFIAVAPTVEELHDPAACKLNYPELFI